MEKMKVIVAVMVVMSLLVYPIFAPAFVDDTQSEFNAGAYSQTVWNTNRVELVSSGGTYAPAGGYRSNVKDATRTATWNTFTWVEPIPFKQNLPSTKGSDAGADMSNNVLYYDMDDPGTLVSDKSGEGNNGWGYGSPQFQDWGKLFYGVRFDGVNDYIDVTNESDFDFERTSSFSGCAWIRPDTTSLGSQTIFGKLSGSAPHSGWEFGAYDPTGGSDGIQLYLINTFPTNLISVYVPNVLSANTWYFACFTYDGSSTASGVKLYLNGVQRTTSTAHNSLTSSILNNKPVQVGMRDVSSWPFDGIIDDVSIYGRVLQASEILNLYKRGVLNLTFNVRSCDDPACTGDPWMLVPFTTPGPNALALPDNRYFQYEAAFSTDDTNYTPELYRVTVDYTLAPLPPIQNKTKKPSLLPLASTNIAKADNLLTQAESLLSDAKAKSLDAASCEKLIDEAKGFLAEAKLRKASPTTANYFALKAAEKLRAALDCLKALLG